MVTYEMLSAFFGKLSDKKHPLTQAAQMVKTNYVKYIYALQDNKPFSLGGLTGRIQGLYGKEGFTEDFIGELLQDLKDGGAGHQALVIEEDDSNLVDRLSSIEAVVVNSIAPVMPSATNIKTGRNKTENELIIDRPWDFYKARELPYSATDNYGLFFSSLPNKVDVKPSTETARQYLMVVHKLTSVQFDALSEDKLAVIMKHIQKSNISSLLQKNSPSLSLSSLLIFNEEKLELLLSNPEWLVSLLKNNSLAQINEIETISQLSCLLKNQGSVELLLHLQAPLKQISTLPPESFNILNEGRLRLMTLVHSNISIDHILKLSSSNLAILLLKPNSPESDALEQMLRPSTTVNRPGN
jgi:hypothetical protein